MNDQPSAAVSEQIVSAPRFARYRRDSSSDLDAAALYLWNIQLTEALLPSIALLEVALRSSVHRVLATHTGKEYWFKTVLQSQMYDNVLRVMNDVTRRTGHPPGADKVVSEITFGFWPKIFAKSYNDLWWSRPHALLQDVLPAHPSVARDTRTRFEARLEYFVSLRNRMMHHESIYQGVSAVNRPALPLEALHQQLVETIEWIGEDATRFHTCLDRFDGVYTDGPQVMRQALHDRFAT